MTRHGVRRAALALVFSLAGCSAATPSTRDPKEAAAGACDPKSPASCEAAIVRSVEEARDAGPATLGLAVATKETDAALDALLSELAAHRGHAVTLIVGAEPKPATRHVHIDALPSSKAVPREQLLVGVADAAGIPLLVVKEGGKTEAAFGHDPLRVQSGGLAAHSREKNDLDVVKGEAMEMEIALAFAATTKFDYVGASDHALALEKLIAGADPYATTTMRAAQTVRIIGLGGSPHDLFDKLSAPRVTYAIDADDTPYERFIKVRLDSVLARSGAKHLPEFPAGRRPLVVRLFDEAGSDATRCTANLPEFRVPADLLFAGLMPYALALPATRDKRRTLSYDAWAKRYDEFLDLAERSDAIYPLLPYLLYERGASSGFPPRGTATYRRVTDIAKRHAAALAELATERPGRDASSALTLLGAPGATQDVALHPALFNLADRNGRAAVTHAKTPEEVLVALLAAGLGGMGLPGEMREKHLTALQAAFKLRIDGDLAKQNGYIVALLRAIDSGYRLITKLDMDPNAAAERVAQALESDPNIAEPGIAALLATFARYGALAVNRGFGAPFPSAKEILPAREKARASLRRALGNLGEGAPAEASKPLDSLTTVVDGFVAIALLTALEEDPPYDPKSGPVCADRPSIFVRDARMKRALAKLRDATKSISSNAEIMTGKSAWARRSRVLVMLVSDAVDVMSATETTKEAGVRFSVTDADAERYLEEALGTFALESDLRNVSLGAYALLRAYYRDPVNGITKDSVALTRLIRGLGGLFADGAGLDKLTILAQLTDKGAPIDVTLRSVTESLFQSGRRNEADVLLLVAYLLSAAQDVAPSEADVALARKHKSDVAAVLAFARAGRRLRSGDNITLDFGADIDALARVECGAVSSAPVVTMMDAISAFRAGKRKEARKSLVALLDGEAGKLLTVPRATYQYRQASDTRILNLNLEIGFGSVLLNHANTMTLGLGATFSGDPGVSLVTRISPPDNGAVRENSSRYYYRALATLALYDALDGDFAEAETHGMQYLGLATAQRSFLSFPGQMPGDVVVLRDSRPELILLAQLLLDSGRPLLAGALLNLTRTSLGGDELDVRRTLLDSTPTSVVGIPEVEALTKRTKKTLSDLVATLPCSGTKDPTKSYAQATCATYSTGLALRIADAIGTLPTLERGSATCDDLGTLDAFVRPLANGTYDPDSMLRATTRLMEAGKNADALLLLTRQRRGDHCNPQINRALETLVEKFRGASSARVDALTVLTNCAAGASGPELATRLVSLDKEVRELGDPVRSAELVASAGSVVIARNLTEPLQALISQPNFLATFERDLPQALDVALLLDHASACVAGTPIAARETARVFDLVCPPGEPGKTPRCELIREMRNEGDATKRKPLGRRALDSLLVHP